MKAVFTKNLKQVLTNTIGDTATRRVDALSLLKELRAYFETLELVEVLALLKENEKDNWFLSVKWVACESERDQLKSSASEYGIEILESNGYTMFHDFRKKP